MLEANRWARIERLKKKDKDRTNPTDVGEVDKGESQQEHSCGDHAHNEEWDGWGTSAWDNSEGYGYPEMSIDYMGKSKGKKGYKGYGKGYGKGLGRGFGKGFAYNKGYGKGFGKGFKGYKGMIPGGVPPPPGVNAQKGYVKGKDGEKGGGKA